MPEGPLGGPRPFAEEGDIALKVIYQFSPHITEDKLGSYAVDMAENLGDKGIEITRARTDAGTEASFIWMDLQSTNIGSSAIDDMREQGRVLEGYREFVISTVDPKDVVRFGRMR